MTLHQDLYGNDFLKRVNFYNSSGQVMNEIFDEKWIGRGVPVAWRPRSPDLTLPDYFLWGFVK